MLGTVGSRVSTCPPHRDLSQTTALPAESLFSDIEIILRSKLSLIRKGCVCVCVCVEREKREKKGERERQ